MKKSIHKKSLSMIPIPTMEPDYVYHYMANKNNNKTLIDMDQLIRSVIYYIQNNDVYFKYDPTFIDGVLVFGIVGYQTNQDLLQKNLGAIINKHNCVLRCGSYYKLLDEK